MDNQKHTPGPLTEAMLRELRAFERTGEPADLCMYGNRTIAFWSRDKVLAALDRRGLIAATPDWTITDAGRAAIAAATGSTHE